MYKKTRYVIVTPVRDEKEYISYTIDSVVSQSILPTEWIIVDDGSTDGTGKILDQYDKEFDWVKIVRRANRGERSAGKGVIEAFNEGYTQIIDARWEFLVKLDGDLSFEKKYFEKCLAHFSSDANLGIGGGTIYTFDNNKLNVDSIGDPPFHVRGATKIYSRSCWENISPLVQAPGWDTIDEVKANMYGWTTRTFNDLRLIQHKPTGSASGRWCNWFKNGVANYITGYHPVFMLAKCAKRSMKKPRIIESMALFAGYCSGYFNRIPQQADELTIRYLRRQQIQRLLLRSSIYGKSPLPFSFKV